MVSELKLARVKFNSLLPNIFNIWTRRQIIASNMGARNPLQKKGLFERGEVLDNNIRSW